MHMAGGQEEYPTDAIVNESLTCMEYYNWSESQANFLVKF
jgi:hypothetical protein